MEHFEQLMTYFMSPKCYQEIFMEFNLTNVDCLSMIASKGLGYAILAGSILLRVPQILKILTANSVEGLSFTSEILMIASIFSTMSYGYFKQFPISTYGDSYALFIQTAIILLLVLLYQKKRCTAIISLVTMSAACYLMYAKMIPESVIIGLNASGLVLAVVSKMNQVIMNFRNSSTGVLSAFQLILQFLGCVARIFTSVKETGDMQMIVSYAVTSAVNGLLVVQLFYYWNKSAAQKTKKE